MSDDPQHWTATYAKSPMRTREAGSKTIAEMLRRDLRHGFLCGVGFTMLVASIVSFWIWPLT